MLSILVASSKGGCGKSTISTELAAYFALAGKRSVIIDADPQRSSSRWCARRAALDHAVLPIDGTRRHWQRLLPADTERLLIDTPAGSTPTSLTDWIELADAVLVPVQPSPIDLEATLDFVQALRELKPIRRGQLQLALVGNRVKPWTTASQTALEHLSHWPAPLVASLRDNQAYALLAGLGRSLFDYRSQAVLAQQQDWQPLFAWLREVNRGKSR